MKKFLLLLSCTLLSLVGYGQKIDKDILGVYTFSIDNYKAEFKKNIFDDLVFSDNKNNKISFQKEYLNIKYPGILDSELRINLLFKELLIEHQNDSGYEAEYKVDGFGAITFQDNRGNTTIIERDVFGNIKFKDKASGIDSSLRVNFMGEVEYQSANSKATLKKLYTDNWLYKDDSGNSIELNQSAWERMLKKFGTKEQVMLFLVKEFVL